MKTGVEIIAEERKRQIEVERWKAEHDDHMIYGQLAKAASIYSNPNMYRIFFTSDDSDVPGRLAGTPIGWPWSLKWWKPSPDNRIKELAKAGALIAAEIDRLQRLAAKEGQTNE